MDTESTLSVKRLPIDRVRARIYRADRSYDVVPISVNSTVAELRPSFNQKLLPHQERETHKPSLKERGRGKFTALRIVSFVFLIHKIDLIQTQRHHMT
jgi:hypothetical protein